VSRPLEEASTEARVAAATRRVAQLERRPAPATGGGRFVIKVFADDILNTVGDGKFIFAMPEDLDGMVLTSVAGFVTTVSSSGLVTVQVRNITDAVDILSTRVTIDASEFTSYTAATAPVINTANDDLATGDLIAIDVDGVGTGSKGLGVILGTS
jgi:hypothetical protein